MNQPVLEPLEVRTLLSGGTLAASAAQLFDVNGDGRNDAVLINTGGSAIEYDYTPGVGLDAVRLTADGGAFTTNLFVSQVGDNDAGDDFRMGSTKIGVNVRCGWTTYGAVAGVSSVVEGEISRLEIGSGDLSLVHATEAGLGKIYVDAGDLTNALAAGAIDSLIVEGDILGTVSAGGDINLICANHLSGASIGAGAGTVNRLAADVIDNYTTINAVSLGTLTAGTIGGYSLITTQQDIGTLQAGRISDATVSVGGGIGSLIVDTLAGTAGGTTISVQKHVGRFQAQTVTGGLNGMLYLSIGAGVDSFVVGQMDGGQSTDGGFSGTFVSINGDVAWMSAGQLSGGTATGAGSFSMLNVAIDSYTDGDGNVQAGDVTSLRVSSMIGGVSVNGGDAMLNFTIAHDLVDARISRLVGTGNLRPGTGHGGHTGCDPSVYLNVGHDIVRLVAGQISAGQAAGDYSYSSVNVTAGNDILSLTADRIDAGSASGAGSMAEVYITAGRHIVSITANVFSGGQATGDGASAGLYVQAAGDIGFIGAGLISGTTARVRLQDPTVHFEAGGDIGMVMAGRITGGTVTSDGVSDAQASVVIQAFGTYVDANGDQHLGDIGKIVTGTIDGGSANGENALSYVRILAAHDIDKLYSDRIIGGQARNDGFAYVSIVALHNINDLRAGLIEGAAGQPHGCDPAVLIQAYNDIKSVVVDQIIAGLGGDVSILAGLDADGNVSGELDADGNLVAGSIESMVVGLISGNGGVVNIAAGGSIECLKACRILSGNGEVNIVAGEDITASVGSVQSWRLQGETGVEFVAGGAVNDIRNSIRSVYVQEGVGQDVEFPDVPALPQ